MSSSAESAPGSFTAVSAHMAELHESGRNRWDSPSERLSTDVSTFDGSPTWAESAHEMRITYKSERVNGYAGGFVGRAEAKYAKMKDADRNIHRHEDDYHVALLTLGGQTRTRHGDYRPPLDFREQLLESRGPVRRALRRIQQDNDGLGWFEVVSGNGSSAYSHVHVVAFFGERVTKSDFDPVRSAHTKHSPVARDITPDNYVTIRESASLAYEARSATDKARGATSGATTYVASQAPHVGGENQTDNQIEHSAICRQSSSWDTYLSPALKERAESERMERELAREQRREKMRVRGLYEPESDTQLPVISHRAIPASSTKSAPGLFGPYLFASDPTFVSPKRTRIPLNPTLRSLLWLHANPVPPDS